MKHVLSLLLVAALVAVALAKDTGAAPASAPSRPSPRHHERVGVHHPKGRGSGTHAATLRQRQEEDLLEKENLMPVMPRALPSTGLRTHKPAPMDLVPKPHKRGAKKFNVKKHAWKKGLHNKDKGLHNKDKGLHNKDKGLHNKDKGIHNKDKKKLRANKEYVRDGHSLKDMINGPRSKKRQIREKRAKLRSHKKSH